MASKAHRKPTNTRHNQGARAQDQHVDAPIDYATVQNDEVEALKAIFMDDFQQIAVESAWSKVSEHRFKLKVGAFSEPESNITLSIRLTATYPKTLPLIEVSGLEAFHERTQARILNVIAHSSKQLLGEVMIHALATEIQEVLEDAVQARQQGTLPSLDDERANAEEAAMSLAKQTEEAQKKLHEEAQQEEQRVLDQMVVEEISRRDRRRAKQSSDGNDANIHSKADEVIRFDQTSTIDVAGVELPFSVVEVVSRDRTIIVGRPITSSAASTQLVSIHVAPVRSSTRDAISEVESTLERVRKLRHRNVQCLHCFRFDKSKDITTATICTELSTHSTLEDLLVLSGTLLADKARQFVIELLEGLEECHRHGIVHENVSCRFVRISNTTPAYPILTNFGGNMLYEHEQRHVGRWRHPASDPKESKTSLKKVDIWDLGVVVLQLSIGLDVTEYGSPQALCNKLPLSPSFEDLVIKMFQPDPKKRPSAFDLLPAEFLRSNDPVLERQMTKETYLSSRSAVSPVAQRSRQGSSNALEGMSRYAQDFVEIGRLGKGGFGEVAKARNKLDGGIYAIKKISRAPQLDRILSEVMLLNRLNHPYVVRYYSTWVEQDLRSTDSETISTTDDATSDGPTVDFAYQSTGGLDFVSSSGYPQIEFGADSDSETDSSESEEAHVAIASSSSGDENAPQIRRQSRAAQVASTLFIQMEFCERRTLRDLVRRSMQEEDSWRFMRQITEGLAHIHSHGIIHRDLKPDNIFIDVAGNPKIGDFGLATTSQYSLADRTQGLHSQASVDMTLSIGTALYTAPELSAGAGSSYNDKVDMYSLGIMFYEMCQPFATAMERVQALQALRKRDYDLPQAFSHNGSKAAQGKVVSCLVSHKPGERPSSTELLRTGLLPVKIEDETIRQALSSLADRSSPNHQTMMSALFAHDQPAETQVRAMAWDAKDASTFDLPLKMRLRHLAKEAIVSVFRTHGAEEVHRAGLLPRSNLYTAPNVFQVLDASGNLLQLPYDLTLPIARKLARSTLDTRCTYTIEHVYRDTFSGGPPQPNEEIDFDITCDSDTHHLTFNEAEVVKVIDEIVAEPILSLPRASIVFHLNHSSLLDQILAAAQIEPAQYNAVKESLSKLGFRHFTWEKIRSELRSPSLGLSSWSVDYLQSFDFREPADKAFARLREALDASRKSATHKLEATVEHLQSVLDHLAGLDVFCRVLIAPLSCINAKFYDNAIMIQCVLERKSTRDVLAAGGRYDSLIQSCRTGSSTHQAQSAVGISIGLDRLVANMLKSAKAGSGKETFTRDGTGFDGLARRCNVLLLTGSGRNVQAAGVRLLATLWNNGISAELGSDDITSTDRQYLFVVTLRHEASTTVKVQDTSEASVDADVPVVSLVSYLQQELREKQGVRRRLQTIGRHTSQPTLERKKGVHVLMSQHRSKKSNKYHIVEGAQQRWAEKIEQWKDAPILAVETRDDVIELLRDARLSDAESWKKALHGVPPNERQYLQQMQELLAGWRKKWTEGELEREACIYNFRTGHSIYYDLGL